MRDFAKATGKLAKTDRIDAEVIAHFGLSIRPAIRPLPGTESRALQGYLARHRQLVEVWLNSEPPYELIINF